MSTNNNQSQNLGNQGQNLPQGQTQNLPQGQNQNFPQGQNLGQGQGANFQKDQTQQQQQQQQQVKAGSSDKQLNRKDFSCLISYSSHSTYKNGVRDIKEHLKMKYPGMDVVADSIPNMEDVFDVKVKKDNGENFAHERISADTLKNSVSHIMNEVTRRFDEEFSRFGFNWGGLDRDIRSIMGSDFDVGFGGPKSILH